MYSRFEIEVKLESGSIEMVSTYIMDNFNEKAFINENTIFFDNYTERNGIFGAYKPKITDPNFNLQNFLKEIKNNAD
jgi:hypothetical protein